MGDNQDSHRGFDSRELYLVTARRKWLGILDSTVPRVQTKPEIGNPDHPSFTCASAMKKSVGNLDPAYQL